MLTPFEQDLIKNFDLVAGRKYHYLYPSPGKPQVVLIEHDPAQSGKLVVRFHETCAPQALNDLPVGAAFKSCEQFLPLPGSQAAERVAAVVADYHNCFFGGNKELCRKWKHGVRDAIMHLAQYDSVSRQELQAMFLTLLDEPDE